MNAWFERRDELLREQRQAQAAVDEVWTALAKAGLVEGGRLLERLRAAARDDLVDVERRCQALFKEAPTFVARQSGPESSE